MVLLVRYEETHQEIIRDTLFQYGRIHIVDISLLDELDLIEAKLNQKIPDFEFVDPEGDTIISKDLEEKVVQILKKSPRDFSRPLTIKLRQNGFKKIY